VGVFGFVKGMEMYLGEGDEQILFKGDFFVSDYEGDGSGDGSWRLAGMPFLHANQGVVNVRKERMELCGQRVLDGGWVKRKVETKVVRYYAAGDGGEGRVSPVESAVVSDDDMKSESPCSTRIGSPMPFVMPGASTRRRMAANA